MLTATLQTDIPLIEDRNLVYTNPLWLHGVICKLVSQYYQHCDQQHAINVRQLYNEYAFEIPLSRRHVAALIHIIHSIKANHTQPHKYLQIRDYSDPDIIVSVYPHKQYFVDYDPTQPNRIEANWIDVDTLYPIAERLQYALDEYPNQQTFIWQGTW